MLINDIKKVNRPKSFSELVSEEYPRIIISHASDDEIFILLDHSLYVVKSEFINPLIDKYNTKRKPDQFPLEYVEKVHDGDYHVDYCKRNEGFFYFHDRYLDNYENCSIIPITSSRKKGFITIKKTIYHVSSKSALIFHNFRKCDIEYIRTILGKNAQGMIGNDPQTDSVGYLYVESERGRGYVRSLKK